MIDIQTFRELQDTAGAEFVQELVDTFLQDAPGALEALRSAWRAQDAAAFRRAAHSLKSNGLTFGANGFAALARALERDGLPVTQQPLDELEDSFARTAAALKEICRG